MVRSGIVIEQKDGVMTLLFDRPEACEKCGQCDGRQHNTTLDLPGDGTVGDRVEVDMPSGRVAQAALLAYAIPVAFLLGGLLVAGPIRRTLSLPLNSDLFTIICAVLGLAIGWLVMRLISKKAETRRHFLPRVVAIYPAEKPPQ